jgi:hypothetical protein
MGCKITQGAPRPDEFDYEAIIEATIRNLKEQVGRIPDKPIFIVPSPNYFLNSHSDFAKARDAYRSAFTEATKKRGLKLFFFGVDTFTGNITQNGGEKVGYVSDDTILFIDEKGTIHELDLDIEMHLPNQFIKHGPNPS